MTAVGSVGRSGRCRSPRRALPRLRSSRRSCFTRARASTIPRASRSCRSRASASRLVRSTSTLASALMSSHSTGWVGLVDGGDRSVVEVLGVGEEQGGVVAVDDETRHLFGGREVVDVVHPRHAADVAEDAVVRPRDPPQQVAERQRDGEQDAVERAEHEHAQRRGDEQDELAAAEPRDAADLGDVDEPDGGVDDECAQGRLRERRDDRREGHHATRTHRREGRQRVQLGAAAHRRADGRAAAAAADGEAGQQPAGDVGGAQGQELLVGVDPLADAVGERPGGQHVVGVGDDGDAQGRADHRGDGSRRTGRAG